VSSSSDRRSSSSGNNGRSSVSHWPSTNQSGVGSGSNATRRSTTGTSVGSSSRRGNTGSSTTVDNGRNRNNNDNLGNGSSVTTRSSSRNNSAIRDNNTRTSVKDNRNTSIGSGTVSTRNNGGIGGGNNGNRGDDNRGNMGGDNGNRGGNNRGNMGGDNGNRGGNDRGNMGGDTGNRGGNDRGGGYGKDRSGRPTRGDNGRGGGRGFNPNNRFDYANHHYRDQFNWNYSHHNWSRPLPPPTRAYRPRPLVWYRPTIPYGWRPYYGAPVIDRILGIVFGSLFDASLDYLYYSGYDIDGYADGVIYLRDVPMLNLTWPDVMLCYNEANALVNAQFVYSTSYYDMARYNRVYRSLCRVYGSPVAYADGTASWYGGDQTGYVTLTMIRDGGRYYTTMSIGY